MGLYCCLTQGRTRLASLVLFLVLASSITWMYIALQLQVEESRQAPRQVIDITTPVPEVPVVSSTLFETTEISASEYSTPHWTPSGKRPEQNVSGPGLLLVLIHASVKGTLRRDTIRDTWLSPEYLQLVTITHGVRLDFRFVLGVKGVTDDLRQQVDTEALQYGDMIFLEDVTDEHATLTNRTLKMFVHISKFYAKDFSFVLKCDDDTFIDLKSVTKELVQMGGKGAHRLFWGDFLGSGYLHFDGPYAEHHWSVCETFLPYALGGGYVLSMDVVMLLARIEPHLKLYKNEDASLGAWLAPFNIRKMSDARFNSGSISRGCKSPYILTHKINATMMHKMYTALMNHDYFCTPEHQWFKYYGHLYNWRLQPSKCCRYSRRVP